MVSEWRNDSTGIFYPSLRTILTEKNETLVQHAQALEGLLQKAFGPEHMLLTRDDRRSRLDLWKLINLTRQLDLLEDVDTFTIGARCPEQLRRYDSCLKRAIRMAYRHGMDLEKLAMAEKTHERLWQIMIAVTQFYEGLS